MSGIPSELDSIRNYYGEVLSSSKDLKTSACYRDEDSPPACDGKRITESEKAEHWKGSMTVKKTK